MSEKLTLTELQLIIRDSLYMSLPEMFWVIAEISEIKENSAGHCYLELIEKHPDEKNVRARVKAIIWNNRYRFLKSLFENITGESIKDGLKILVKAKVEYHEIYGLSLVITDIDPAFTLGELAMKRQLVINRLQQEGVFTMNRELEIPCFPQRIAIISSKNAAGYTDFMNHLTTNNYGYVFYTCLFESLMQGPETEQGVIIALDKIADNAHMFDLVVIIRGGGSQSDLSWFDSYNIAYHITQFPLPVITGIGHEKDLSVTDMVANQALKTPTATADFIIDTTAETENHIMSVWLSIKEIAAETIGKSRSRLDSAQMKLQPLSQIIIAGMKESISDKVIDIISIGKDFTSRAGGITVNQRSRLISVVRSFAKEEHLALKRNNEILGNLVLNYIELNRSRLEAYENTLKILNPFNVLKRGYTITSLKGQIITNKDKLKEDDIIDTQFSDGVVRSIVTEKHGPGPKNSKK
jgi:exodeoxyribonuclease VII large subunit